MTSHCLHYPIIKTGSDRRVLASIIPSQMCSETRSSKKRKQVEVDKLTIRRFHPDDEDVPEILESLAAVRKFIRGWSNTEQDVIPPPFSYPSIHPPALPISIFCSRSNTHHPLSPLQAFHDEALAVYFANDPSNAKALALEQFHIYCKCTPDAQHFYTLDNRKGAIIAFQLPKEKVSLL